MYFTIINLEQIALYRDKPSPWDICYEMIQIPLCLHTILYLQGLTQIKMHEWHLQSAGNLWQGLLISGNNQRVMFEIALAIINWCWQR